MSRKSGQAITEFMMGLSLIVVLILSISFLATYIKTDHDSFFEAREAVANQLVEKEIIELESPIEDLETGFQALRESIDANSDYAETLDLYPSDLIDGFEKLWSSGGDPFEECATYDSGRIPIDIDSPALQDVTGRTEVFVENKVWMPTWKDFF